MIPDRIQLLLIHTACSGPFAAEPRSVPTEAIEEWWWVFMMCGLFFAIDYLVLRSPDRSVVKRLIFGHWMHTRRGVALLKRRRLFGRFMAPISIVFGLVLFVMWLYKRLV